MYHVSFPGLGIHDLTINNIAFTFSIAGKEISIYWYGIIIASAFLICIFWASKEAPRFGMESDDIYDAFLWIIILALVGARLYYVAFSWDYFKDNLMKIFQTRHGGLAFYGGLIGGMIAVVITARKKKINLMRFVDFFAVYVPLGQAIGRWGNFINQEAFGTNTDLPWGMWSERTYEYLDQFGQQYAPMSPVHPTFLYESIANLIICYILYRVRKTNRTNGKVFSVYLILYGIVRFFVEGLRTDSLYIGNTDIRISQALSLVFVLAGLVIYLMAKKNMFGNIDPEALAFEAAEAKADLKKAKAEMKKTKTDLSESKTEMSETEMSETEMSETEMSETEMDAAEEKVAVTESDLAEAEAETDEAEADLTEVKTEMKETEAVEEAFNTAEEKNEQTKSSASQVTEDKTE